MNMIQGLGAKHMSLLPDAKEEEDNSPAMHGKSIEHIKNWAEGVQEGPEEALERTTKPDSISDPEPKPGGTRKSVFDTTGQADSRENHSHLHYNLKEIRVGESPSRLGGVTVPMPFDDDDNDEVDDDDDDDKAYSQPAAEGRDSQTSLLQERPRQQRVGRHHPRMVFTGPVFIGYSPEQAANVLRQSGQEERRDGHRVSLG